MTIEIQPGAVLRDKYRVERVLGMGGMGVVLEARHVELDRRVAIKVLHAELRRSGEVVERFLREGRAASKIEGDHVARVLDVDRLPDGTPFLVMEYLEGHDLSAARKAKRPLPIHEAVDYVLQACVAIADAHRAGIIHRDLKPANLFLARLPDGTTKVKVLDFGISKTSGPLGGSEPSMTSTTLVMGSAEYMSPEQMLSLRDVDLRTDIWALGAVLFELLTARVPFEGDTVTKVCAMVMTLPPARPRALRPELPESLEAVILRCLEKDRERRFASVAELVSALRALAPQPSALVPAALPVALPVAPPTVPADGRSTTGTSALPMSETDAAVWREPSPEAPKRRGAALLALAAACVALLGLGAVGLGALGQRDPAAGASGAPSPSLEATSAGSAAPTPATTPPTAELEPSAAPLGSAPAASASVAPNAPAASASVAPSAPAASTASSSKIPPAATLPVKTAVPPAKTTPTAPTAPRTPGID